MQKTSVPRQMNQVVGKRGTRSPYAGALLISVIAMLARTIVAGASSLTVPDDATTIQGALNSGVDTVFVRSGVYPESPVVSFQVAIVSIQGDPAFEHPVLSGLKLLPASTSGFSNFSFRELKFTGQVYIRNSDELSFVTFHGCDFADEIVDNSGHPATVELTLRRCRMAKDAFLKVDGYCVIDSCVFEGQLTVGQQDCRLVVMDSQWHGSGTGIGIATIGGVSDVFSARITDVVIDRYSVGISLSGITSVVVENTTVRDCGWTGIVAGADVVRIRDTSVERCAGYGLKLDASDTLVVESNTIVKSGDSGMLATVSDGGTITGNVVWGCGRDGIHVGANPVTGVLQVRGNTICLNGGSGILSECSVDAHGRYEVEGNIGYGNNGYGVRWGVPEVSVVECNDWFGNGLGDVQGMPPSSSDFSANPFFCNPDSGDFRLRVDSPLVDRLGCGLVGAMGAGCGITATLLSRFTAQRVRNGIEIVWEVGEGATASYVWLERADEGDLGPWIRPTTARSRDGRAEIELDQSATPDRRYWYRLVANEGHSEYVIGPPIVVGAEVVPSFRLIRLGPNPASGSVRIEFAVREQAAIEIDVFDVQGRLVASPARGVWPAGAHSVDWFGLAGRSPAAGGVYLVRYRYPGGQDRRRLVRTP